VGTYDLQAPVGPGLALPLRGSDRRWARAWLLFLIGGLGLAIACALLGDERAVQPLLTALGLTATVAILAGVRINRPASSLPWHLVALCTLLTTVGIGVMPRTGNLGVLGEVLTAVGYAAGFAGFVLLIRGRIPGGERAAFLDAAILASGVGIVIWAFGFAPYAVAARQSTIVAAAYFYPALIASAVAARMWFLRGTHRPATRLLVLLVLASNGITILDMLRGFVGAGAFVGLYLLAEFASLAFVGAAALHPSMSIASERQRADNGPIGRRRLLALAAALLVNPATLAIEVWAGHRIDPAPYLIGGVILGLLVIARLGDALRQLGESLRERESLMELLRRQALYDTLTSLPNRSLFTERLTVAFANRSDEQPLAVLMIDLDEFKAINDSYGHETGDELLIAVGGRLRESIRDGDTAARLGGDEFIIVLPGCHDPLVPMRIAQRVLTALNMPFDIAGRSLTVGASVGVAVAGADDRTADDLVRDADVAMYLAKSRGKGRVEIFEPSMQAAALTQLQLRADLAAGIAGGDLRLHFQPVIDLRTDRTVGYEALVRWLRDGRLVAPGEFIPMAESSGLIGPLTDWVVDEACRTTAAWGRSGERPWVSVNLASSQLVRPDFVDRLGRTLADNGLPADRLVLEITESSLVEIDIARPAIERLSQLGVRLAIDDFGIGYSALSYLAHLPIDIVKIDRSFIAALVQDGPEEAMASAIMALAKRLDMTTVGEGIETAAQLEQLRALGCDLGQGFYLGRPAPGEDVAFSPLPRGHRLRGPTLAVLGA
jgi:diguanylate cyclase